MKVHKGIILFTDETPIGFGKAKKLMINNQKKHTAGAWPNYKRAGFKHRKPSEGEINAKHLNSVIGNPFMNS